MIEKKTDAIAKKIVRRHNHVKPGLKTKGFFFLMHMLQKNGRNEADINYRKKKGWTEKKRPWKE